MARGDFPSSKQDQFVLRFPEGMRDRIREVAEKNSRSMNAEIVHRLERYGWAEDDLDKIQIAFRKQQELFSQLRDDLIEAEKRNAEHEQTIKDLLEQSADLKFRLRATQNEADALKEQARDAETLREKVAYQEGVNASLREMIRIVIGHALEAERGGPVSLEEIKAVINRFLPAHQQTE